MNEMISRVSSAIADAAVPHNRFTFRDLIRACCVYADGPIALTMEPRGTEFMLEEIARLAIAAMREPTEAMGQAGERAMGAEGAHDCEVREADIYRAMIDAALADHPGAPGDAAPRD